MHLQPENPDRWMVSYADFITLLFALFVVMYSASSVNDGKYRVLSDSLEIAFSEKRQGLDPIQIGDIVQGTSPIVSLGVGAPPSALVAMSDLQEAALDGQQTMIGSPKSAQSQVALEDIGAVREQLQGQFADLIAQGVVDVRENDGWLEVELASSILFDSGNARLSDTAIPILQKFATTSNGFSNPIRVQGFTDDVPIGTDQFPSNWELSAARAASTVHLLSKLGVQPQQLSAIGSVSSNRLPTTAQRKVALAIDVW